MTQTSGNAQTRAINLRVRGDVRAIIDQAARVQGRSRSDFMIEAARRAAEETILDQTVIRVNPDGYEAFVSILDTPGEPNENLRKTMRTPAPWE